MTLADRLRAMIEAPLADMQGADTHLNDAELRADSVDAAVLIPIVDRLEPGVILTRRTDELPSHPGQVAFPGGKVDPGDDGPVDAALRESEEEIALPRDRVEIIGTTDLYLTGTGFHITPVIGIVPPGLDLVPEAGEVAAIFEVPFDTLFDPANYDQQHVHWNGRPRSYHEMYWDEHRIWGVTAAIILNFARRIRAVAQ
ncbi:MAG: CoA pyrophosphatase [Parasphingopyxis sp.]|uniref:CoA pyrophosphatase n=1 Tax=Parasphingopyxis sp. TaxID=1920299 RepID=UPI00260620D9|nr:CoA pyrophosphatase [uncultured Parasphingopyxis sp.]